MIVLVTERGASVRNADDCTGLHVRTALTGAGLDAQLCAHGLGRVAPDGDVELDRAVLRTLASAAASATDWNERWERMIAYAERFGWTSEDGLNIRAHVETEL